MINRKKRNLTILGLVFVLLLTGCQKEIPDSYVTGFAPKADYQTDGKAREREEACFRFVTEKMMHQGGMYTRYLDSMGQGTLADGHEVLAESEGLLLRYAVQRSDERLYQDIKKYIRGTLEKEHYLSYRADSEGKAMKVNACVDDLRIIRGLYEGGDKDLALRYAKQLRDTNLKKGLLVDFYTASDKKSGDEMTLCYGDLTAMDDMAGELDGWQEIRENTEKVMLGGYLGDAFPLFQTKYHVKKQKYISEDIFMTEAVLTTYHLAEVGKCPQTTVDWLKERLRDGKICARYTVDGDVIDETESTAIYAICLLIGQAAGEEEMVRLAEKCLERFQVLDTDSEVYGAFAESLEVYSFDNLMALLALRTLALEEPEEETAEETADTLLIADASERKILEPLIQGLGKRTDYLEKGKADAERLENYCYIVTTDDKKGYDGENKIFAIGTTETPGELGSLSEQNEAFVEFELESFAQTGRNREHLFYLDGSEEGQVYGRMVLAPGREFPYCVVNGDDAYASYVEDGDLSTVALGSALQDFFDLPKTPGNLYVMIDEIYPFTNQNMLKRMGEDLYQNGIPFLLNVMPVYDNLGYPAFGKWADRLADLQMQGGTVVMHDPVDTGGTDAEEEKIASKMMFAESALEHQGVTLYPMKEMPVTLTTDFLKRVTAESREFPRLSTDALLVLPVYEEKEAWEKSLALLQEKWLNVQDYRGEFPEVESIYETPEEEKKPYVYREEEKVSMKAFFDKSNHILLVLVGAAILIYLVILLSSAFMYNRKFKHKKD